MRSRQRAAVDIGTNSMRMLVVDDKGGDLERRSVVTGLGRGVDADGSLGEDAIARTISVLARFGERLRPVERRRAVATSATRRASNRDAFLDRAEEALGFRPEVISGGEEAALAFTGATADFVQGPAGGANTPTVVDIGGGSTEFVSSHRGEVQSRSVEIGSVRLTDRLLRERPVPFELLAEAGRIAHDAMQESVGDLLTQLMDGPVLGVAGTWTSVAAIIHARSAVHHTEVARHDVDEVTLRLAQLSIDETSALPGLDPARAPVILGGAVVAREAMRLLGCGNVSISERDLLDGIISTI